ncbi:MAG: hypothetical protein WEC59_08355 [Salibacteraceae bacterium]
MYKERKLKEVLLLLMALVLVFQIKAQKNDDIKPNGYNKFYFDDGVLSSEGMLENGKPEGYWKNYYHSGVLKSEGNRLNSELDSIWKFYNEEGILVEEISYKKGKRNGVTKIYSKEGFLTASVPYENDKKHGVGFTYFSNGAIKTETVYKKGAVQGLVYEFDPKGDIITITTYDNGIFVRKENINRKDKSGEKEGLWKTFYDDRTVKSEGRYTNNKKDGYWKDFSPKGMLVATYKYENGKLITDAEEITNLDVDENYYEDSDGKIKFRGTYRNGKPHGTHIWFAEDGSIDSAKVFKNNQVIAKGSLTPDGLRVGPWKEYYYPSEKLKAEGEYRKGYRYGEWIYYFENGTIQQRGVYSSKEQPEGKWKWFYENGNILREEDFKQGKEHGWLIEYSDTGKIISRGEFVNGLEEGEWFYEVGDHLEEGSYEGGLKQGEWTHSFISTGKQRFFGYYFDGLEQGEHIWFYDNGNKMLEGKYVSGVKEGEWRRYNKDGSIFVTIEYQSGREIKVDGFKIKIKQQEEKNLEEEAP